LLLCGLFHPDNLSGFDGASQNALVSEAEHKIYLANQEFKNNFRLKQPGL
jgi:hypothetical protein